MVSDNLPLVVTYDHPQLDALGDGMRRAILQRLRSRPQAVGELARAFPVSRPAISQHLRILKDAGLVTDRAYGTKRVYAVHAEGLRALRDFFDGFWTDALEAFKAQAEAEAGPDRPGSHHKTPGPTPGRKPPSRRGDRHD
jgi:DNA-binding transcriptional ArsR family regulator